MPLVRCFLAFLILVMQDASGASIAEEINFQVANMRESTKNDPQAQELDMMEYEQEDMVRDETDDPELSPSEIVETHVLPDGVTPEELNVQMKRPRRRRRRRRRKRPKPTANPEDLESYYAVSEDESKRKPVKYRFPDAHEAETPDDKNPPRRRNQKRRRRPLKRPAVDDYLTTAEEHMEYTNNTGEHMLDYINIEPSEENQNNHAVPAPIEDYPQSSVVGEETEYMNASPVLSLIRKPTVRDNEVSRVTHEEMLKTRHKTTDHDISRPLTSDQSMNYERHKDSSMPPVQDENLKFQTRNKDYESHRPIILEDHKPRTHNRESELPKTSTLPVQGEQIYSPKRRNRPSVKNENVTAHAIKSESEQNKAETSQKEIKNHTLRKPDNRNHEVQDHNSNKAESSENIKAKNENLKPSESIRNKEIFKIRRLPPTSAILRYAKTRPLKNVTASTSEFRNVASNRTDDNLSNDILHPAEVSTLKPEQTEVRVKVHAAKNITEDKKLEEPVQEETAETSFDDFKGKFELPIIKYVEQKQSAQPTSTSTTTTTTTSTTTTTTTTAPTTASSTTENTAFIYISCNHTINEVLKNTFNFTADNITLAATKYLSLIQNHTHSEPVTTKSIVSPINYTQVDTMDALKSMAMEELEKLLQQVRTETTITNSTTVAKTANNTKNQIHTLLPFEHLDSGESESQLDYHVQKNVIARTSKFPQVGEPEEVRDSTEHYFREAKRYQDGSKYKSDSKNDHKYENPFAKSPNSNKELILTYTSTSNPNFFFNEIDQEESQLREKEISLHLRNNASNRKTFNENAAHRIKSHSERKKLPLAVKSAIIISGAILALAVLGFFALLLSCKIRQAKSRMKCHRELYREQFQNSEFRQSSRSTSPVVSKSNYSGRSFNINNNIQSNVASNRNYYLWQTLRKTFQYD